MVNGVGAELFEQPQMGSLRDVVIVHRPEHRPVGIGVAKPPLAVRIGGVVAQRLALADFQLAVEEAVISARFHRSRRLAGQRESFQTVGVRHESARDQAIIG